MEKWKFVETSLPCHPRLVERSSVMNENCDRSGIRTNASEYTAALTQRGRPLGHPACKIKNKPTFVFVKGVHPLSRVSLEVLAFCNLPFHGFYLWLKVNSGVFFEGCMQVTYAFPPLFCLLIAPSKKRGRSPMNRRCLLCPFHSLTVWQTFNFENIIHLVWVRVS